MKKALLLFTIFVGTLNASPSAATIEAHYFAEITKAYQEAALVGLAYTSSDERNEIIDICEVWKAAPGYSAGKILIPKEHPSPGRAPRADKTLCCFSLKGMITSWGGFSIRNERVILAPQYSLPELRKVLAEGLRSAGASLEPTPVAPGAVPNSK